MMNITHMVEDAVSKQASMVECAPSTTGSFPRFDPFPQKAAMCFMVIDELGGLSTRQNPTEQVVFVIEGMLEAWIEGERRIVEAGGLLLIPPMKKHRLSSMSAEDARVIGFFPTAES
jgi:quercetin dioxygenase-like cupin family protein